MPQAHERDLQDTAKRLTEWLSHKLPDASDLRVGELRAPSDTGFSSDTLMVDLEWAAAGELTQESLVVRMKPSGFQIFPTYDIAAQFHVMRVLHDSDVPVPRMRWLEEDRSVLGSPFYVMDRVDGRVPSDRPPYHMDGWIAELAPEQREELWWSGVDCLARVHNVKWQGRGLDFLAQPERGETPIAQQLQYYDHFMSWGMERKGYPLLERAYEWLLETKPSDEPVRICWGDSRLANMIFQGQTCVAVIDWEMATLGNPVEDLAWWITLDRCFSEGIGVERLPGFPDRAATVGRWESRTGHEAKHLPYYEVFAAFRFSVIMARLGLQMKHYGVFPDDSRFDTDNLGSTILQRQLDDLGV